MPGVKNIIYYAIVLLLGLCLHSCEEELGTNYKEEYQTLYSYLEVNEEFHFFRSIVDAAIIPGSTMSAESILSSYNNNEGGDGYTLFLPENETVTLYLNTIDISLEELLMDPDRCFEIVTHHLLNGEIKSNDFPNGELPDKSLNGVSHFVRYMIDEDGGEVSYLIDEEANVLNKDIYVSNGIIHVLDNVLTPFTYTSCEWLDNTEDCNIFVEALKLTGLYDELQDEDVELPFTIFVEADEIFAQYGINDTEGLKEVFSNDRSDYTDKTNPLNQFIAYHVLRGNALYISDITEAQSSYETYTDYPLLVSLGEDLSYSDDFFRGIGLNEGVLDTIMHNSTDTTFIDHVSIFQYKSNKSTLSGVIHYINYMMLVDTVIRPTTLTIQFWGEPAIGLARNSKLNTTYSIHKDSLSKFSLGENMEYIDYYRSDDSKENASSGDYISFFLIDSISYTTPSITPGIYQLQLKMDVVSSFGIIDVFVDDKKVGTSINIAYLEQGANTAPYLVFDVGAVNFPNKTSHKVALKAVIPGTIIWDFIRFSPQ